IRSASLVFGLFAGPEQSRSFALLGIFSRLLLLGLLGLAVLRLHHRLEFLFLLRLFFRDLVSAFLYIACGGLQTIGSSLDSLLQDKFVTGEILRFVILNFLENGKHLLFRRGDGVESLINFNVPL